MLRIAARADRERDGHAATTAARSSSAHGNAEQNAEFPGVLSLSA
jgi:hypothetical protein